MTANLGQKETSMIWYSDICQVLNWVTVNSLNSEENYHCKAGKDVLLWEEESTGNRQRQDLNPGLYDTGLSCWLCGKESACQCRRRRRHGFDPWVKKIPWRKKWLPTPVFLPGKVRGQRSLAGFSSWGHKELDLTEWLSMHKGKWCFLLLFEG